MKFAGEEKHGLSIKYVNESGCECEAFLEEPLGIDHYYYKSKRNKLGVYEKVVITNFAQFLKLLDGCTKIRIKQV